MTLQFPKGFRAAGVHCGVKRNPQNPDVGLFVSDVPCTAAGVYTKNLVCAAPVIIDQARTPSDNVRLVVVNSGNANACTGEQGDRDAQEMVRLAAGAVDAAETQALVMSTGVIGVPLPMEKVSAGIRLAAEQLGDDEKSLHDAERAIMTTDKFEKVAGRTISIDGNDVQVTGFAKGAGMIGPNMATMLCLVLTDAAISPENAQSLLKSVADETFNCISVEGHTSTNDTLLLLANGAAGTPPLEGELLEAFRAGLTEVCAELARMIPTDGEGATHLITIEVEGCQSDEDAQKIAHTVANSILVKTAIAGGDPNWGRIMSAAGYAGPWFDLGQSSLLLNGIPVYRSGQPLVFDEAAVSQSIRETQETTIRMTLGDGPGRARHWTSDLTVDYVKFNSLYRT